jgi:hypothetical protein
MSIQTTVKLWCNYLFLSPNAVQKIVKKKVKDILEIKLLYSDIILSDINHIRITQRRLYRAHGISSVLALNK